MFAAGLDVIRLVEHLRNTASRIYKPADVPKHGRRIERQPLLPPPEQMLARMLRIEYALGRIRDVHMGPRTIDLDLLIYKDERAILSF